MTKNDIKALMKEELYVHFNILNKFTGETEVVSGNVSYISEYTEDFFVLDENNEEHFVEIENITSYQY